MLSVSSINTKARSSTESKWKKRKGERSEGQLEGMKRVFVQRRRMSSIELNG